MMSLPEFLRLIDRFGGEIADWPPEPQTEGRRLLSASAEARAALAGMRRVETTIRETRAPAPEPGALTRMAFAASAAAPPSALSRRSPRLEAAAAGFGLAAAIVLSLGVLLGAHQPSLEDPGSALSLAFEPHPDPADVD